MWDLVEDKISNTLFYTGCFTSIVTPRMGSGLGKSKKNESIHDSSPFPNKKELIHDANNSSKKGIDLRFLFFSKKRNRFTIPVLLQKKRN